MQIAGLLKRVSVSKGMIGFLMQVCMGLCLVEHGGQVQKPPMGLRVWGPGGCVLHGFWHVLVGRLQERRLSD